MEQLIKDIKAYLLGYSFILNGYPVEFGYVGMYNGQPEKIKEPREDGVEVYLFSSPSIFIEMITQDEVMTLGNGCQSFDPLDIRLHIYHVQEDNGIGTYDENLDVLALAQQVYEALQNHQFNFCSSLFRINFKLDYSHNNVYIYLLTFRCSFVDNTMNKPVGGQSVPGSVDIETGKVHVVTDLTVNGQ